ncbi:hypothetical protein Acr_17g0008020 [Actinidia rufa]|uniref:Uncharacterized protein n=1 Tax=Actinidia rufa TaxID=165716 RepID=A0A7J0G374_9ERIC|nr:hypothetical protein Acr_17g0008020 [Actinidia rufa]
MRTRVSSRFKLPTQLGVYDGKIDPMDHLDLYMNLMTLQGYSDEVMCKAFSATLRGPTRAWFKKLSPRTIDSFGNLSRLFVANFMSCRVRKKEYLPLIHSPSKGWGEFEGLRQAFQPSRTGGTFLKPKSALQSKAKKYIAAEELVEAKRKRRGKDDNKRKELDSRRAEYRDKDFIIVDCLSPFNAILCRLTLGKVNAITSTYHLMMKFSTSTGIGEKLEITNTEMEALRDEVEEITLADPRETKNTKPLEEVTQIFIHPDYSNRHVIIGIELNEKLHSVLVEFLKKKYDVFAWSHGYVPGIDPQVAVHKLFMDPDHHPIKMYLPDVAKTSFITERGLYYYKVMPFGLKNTEATYQIVNKMFKEMIGKTMEVDIDDMLVKSLKAGDHIAHMREAFSVLRKHHMMLNPSKCIFGVSSRKFLGFPVTKCGIEVRLQVGRSSFKILRKNQAFQWTGEFEEAFQQLKEYLGSPPLLTVPTTGEELIVYLSVSSTVVSAVLIREDDKVQKPVYYASKVLMGAKTRYLKIKKLTYALLIASRKLRHYFQSHPIAVLTDQLLKQILQRPDTSGRLLKWSIEPNEFHISYRPRMAIKAQTLVDFIAEFTYNATPELKITLPEVKTPKEQNLDEALTIWKLRANGFKATNNEAEYEALLAGLRVVIELGMDSLNAFSDSQLVVNQVQGDYLTKDSRMVAYLDKAKTMTVKIQNFKICQIPKEENKKDDALPNLASAFYFISDRSVPMEFLPNPSIEVSKTVCQIEAEPTWMDDITAYLRDRTLPPDKLQSRRIQYRSIRFCLLYGVLYKKSFSGPLLRCSDLKNQNMCSEKFMKMEQDAATYTRKYDKCHRFALLRYKRKFLIVAIDYFTKWIEAEPLSKITEKSTRNFIWKNIVYRFGIPKVILGIQISKDRENRKLRLSQVDYVSKVLKRFNTESAKPVSTPLASHYRLSNEQGAIT